MTNQESFGSLQSKINLYFDNALSPQDQKDLLNQVDCDPRCQKLFHKEKHFREYIKKNVRRPSVSAELIQSIKDRIRVI